ncbi:hypothetical protein YC2023_057003 [Brassica napus]
MGIRTLFPTENRCFKLDHNWLAFDTKVTEDFILGSIEDLIHPITIELTATQLS